MYVLLVEGSLNNSGHILKSWFTQKYKGACNANHHFSSMASEICFLQILNLAIVPCCFESKKLKSFFKGCTTFAVAVLKYAAHEYWLCHYFLLETRL